MATVTGQTITQLTLSVVEKDVENSYRQYISKKIQDMIFTSPFQCDGFGVSEKHNIRLLCEFKKDSDFSKKLDRSVALSQVIVYIKKFELIGQKLPNVVLIGDRNEWFVLHTNDLFKYLSVDIDWSIAPSNAHSNKYLMDLLVNDEHINPFIFSIDQLDTVINKIMDLSKNIVRKIPITPHNLTEVFSYFEKNVLGKHSLNTNQLSNLFVQILINPDDNYLHPVKKRKTIVTKSFNEVPVKTRESFSSFFNHFSDNYTPTQREDLTAVVDRLIQDVTRRKQGEYFTPTIWVDKAHEYIASVYGDDWKEKYVVWDPAWGTGNLTRDYKFKELYVSTLNYSDIQTADQMGYNPEAVKFQFDFLNEDYDFLPKGLRDAIESGRNIIVLMNPPYGTARTDKNVSESKSNIGKTNVNLEMLKNKLGEPSKQLYAQFLYNVIENFKIKNIVMFSPSLFLTTKSYNEFRNIIFKDTKVVNGFILNAKEFDGTSEWPILLSIFKNDEPTNKFNLLQNNNFEVLKVGEKTLEYLGNERGCDWVKIQGNKVKTTVPNLSSTLQIKNTEKLGIEGMLFVLNNGTNRVEKNEKECAFLSSMYSGNIGVVVDNSNFNKCVSLFTARKSIKPTWLNMKDEYYAPNEKHEQYPQFTNDSVVYSIFNNRSYQSSLRQVTYKDQLWDIKNEFFWMSNEEMTELGNNNNYNELYGDARTDKNRYVYNLLFGEKNIYEQLSPDAKLVLDKATELVRMSMVMRSHFADDHNHLNSWDAGYAQLKLVWKEYFPEEFKEFRQLYKNLEDRMRPLVYELGFLLK